MRKIMLWLSLPLVLSACKTDTCGSEFAASSFAKTAVTESLKAPSTAEFTNVQAHADGECTYLVAGRVSAQNSFGAQIQNVFSVSVEFERGSNNYRVYDLLMTE
jgi:hypothetical protein